MRISDWSSDVCSSDLGFEYRFAEVVGQDAAVGAEERRRAGPLRRPPPLRAERTDVAVGDVESDHARAGVDAGAAERALQQQVAVIVYPLAAGAGESDAQIGSGSCRERVCQSV